MDELKANLAVQVRYEARDWRDAIRAAGNLLVEKGMAETSYVQAMIKIIEEKGPYVVLTKGLAMPHARPEDGALRAGICILTLATPVEFGHPRHDPVQVVAALSSVDDNSHLAIMSRLAKILGCKDTLQSLIEARTSPEIFRIFERGCAE